MPSVGGDGGATSVSFVSGFGVAEDFGFDFGFTAAAGGDGVPTAGLLAATTGAGVGRRSCCAQAASSVAAPIRHAREIGLRMRSILFAPGEDEYKKVSDR